MKYEHVCMSIILLLICYIVIKQCFETRKNHQSCKYLYVFVSCTKYSNRWSNLQNIMNLLEGEYIIIKGGAIEKCEGDIVTLECDDSYAGLPEKIICACKYVSVNYPGYGIIKIDDDIEIYERLETHLSGDHYCGWRVHQTPPDPRWHIGRVPNSSWNDIEYMHDEWTTNHNIPYKYQYADGGAIYSLSNYAVSLISNSNIIPNECIYEDVMIGGILAQSNIHPKHLYGLTVYGGRGKGDGYDSYGTQSQKLIIRYKNKNIIQLDDSTH